MSARLPGASPPGVTVGTVGTGPKARDEVGCRTRVAPAPGVLASGPTGTWSTCYSKQPFLLRSAIPFRVGRRRLRPVLKHGPRSLTCIRVVGLSKPEGEVKAKNRLRFEG